MTRILAAACLFDMDGLLLDTERLFLQAFVQLAAPLGIPQTAAEAFYAELVGTSSAETTQRLQDLLPQGTDLAEFDARWRDLHRANLQNGVPEKAFVRDVLQAVKSQGIPMAVVTSTHREPALHHLQTAGLLDFFETVCAGDEVQKNKPDPQPYLTAAARLNVDPVLCVAFEDSDTGTTAAVAAGCKTVQVPDLRPKDKALPQLGQIVARDLRHGAVQVGLFDGVLT